MSSFVNKLKHIRLFRIILYFFVGVFTYPGLVLFNKMRISGTENLEKLPKGNVLFVSNHQTYFADVITFLHIFSAVKWRKRNRLGVPYYLLNPFTNLYYVAAEETMNGSFISKIFKMAGALTVKRTWREGATEVRRGLDPSDTKKITNALKESWIITFPQGTTKPFAPGRKGTSFIIKNCRPIVVPIVINGFWRAFNKKGLVLKKRGSVLSIRIKEPMVIDYDLPSEVILEQVMDAIEQSKRYMLKGRHHLMGKEPKTAVVSEG